MHEATQKPLIAQENNSIIFVILINLKYNGEIGNSIRKHFNYLKSAASMKSLYMLLHIQQKLLEK